MRDVPRWALRWLELTVPRTAHGDAVVGDLVEEYIRRVDAAGGEGSERAARQWFRREARGIGTRYVFERARRRVGGKVHPRLERHARRKRRVVLGDLLHDVQHGLRSLSRSPAYAAVAVVTLALGIGINAAAFTVVDSLTFRPLPVRDAERLVAVYGERGDEPVLRHSYADWADYRRGTRDVFEDVAASSAWAGSFAEAGGQGEMVWTELVTGNFFAVVQPRAALGRMLLEEDEAAVVLSQRFWQRRFGSDTDVVGRTVAVNGQPFTVVGVAGGDFVGTRLLTFAPDVWVPLAAWDRIRPAARGALEDRARTQLLLHARLRSGVSMMQANVATDAVARQLGEAFPETHRERTTRIVSNQRPENVAEIGGHSPAQARFAGTVALAGVGLILLIACMNVANLQLARGMSRRRDVALRMALGASRGRVVQQRIVESLLISAAGGVLGIGVAVFLNQLELLGDPRLEFAIALRPSVEWRVVLYTAALVAAAAVLAGLWPAARESRADPAAMLQRHGGGSARSMPAMGILVAVQVAVSVVVLTATGLLFQSMQRYQALPAGFPIDDGLVLTIDPSLNGYTPAQVDEFFHRFGRELRSLPGVERVSRATAVPLLGGYVRAEVDVEGAERLERAPRAHTYAAEPGWFATLGTPLIEGRDFTAADTAGAPAVVVVNQTLARRLFPEGGAVGRQVRVGSSTTARIIGIAPDTRVDDLGERPQPVLVRSIAQTGAVRARILLRTSAPPQGVAAAVSRTLARIDPTLPVIGPRTLADATFAPRAAGRAGAAASAIMGVLALVLTVTGLYGVIWYGVTRRRREIGIRMALGANASRVAGSVMLNGLGLVGAGLFTGMLLALAASGVMRRMLYGISPADPRTLLLVGAFILAVGALATWIPARRASRVDPLRVLRSE
jgi:predicted permease